MSLPPRQSGQRFKLMKGPTVATLHFQEIPLSGDVPFSIISIYETR